MDESCIRYGELQWSIPTATPNTVDYNFGAENVDFILVHTAVLYVVGGEANTLTEERSQTMINLGAHTISGSLIIPLNYTIHGSHLLMAASGASSRLSVSFQKLWKVVDNG